MEKFRGKFIGIKFWNVFFAVLAVIGLIFIILLSFILPFLWAVFSTVVLVSIILGSVLAISYDEVEHKHVSILEETGKYIGRPVGSGWYFLFPFGDFISVKDYISLKDERLPLFEKEEDSDKIPKIDFRGVSCEIRAYIFYRVVDPEKAAYGVFNFKEGLKDKFEPPLRTYLGSKSLKEAIEGNVREALLEKIEKTEKGWIEKEGVKEEEVGTDGDSISITEWVEEYWGIKVFSLLAPQIFLPDDIIEIRKESLKAEIGKQVALYEKERRETLSQALTTELEAEGEGLASMVKKMIEAGASEAEIMRNIRDKIKWESIGKNPGGSNLVVDNGSDGVVGTVLKAIKASKV